MPKQSLADKYSRGGTGEVPGFIPTRSPIMNYFLGGGLPLNSVTTIHGNEGSYKTTFLLETLAQVQTAGGIAVAASNESSVKRERLNMIGGVGGDLVLKEHAPPEYILTIERIRREFAEIFKDVREEDFENALKEIRDGKCTLEKLKWYYEKLSVAKTRSKDKKTGSVEVAKILAQLRKLKASDEFFYLHPQHKTLLGFGIDSGTACPSDKGVSTDGRGVGNEAMAWREFFKYQQFLDHRSLLVMVNQTSTKFSDNFMTWEDEAAPKATYFHSHVRLNFRVTNKNVLRKSVEGMVKFTEEGNRKDLAVGASVIVNIKKNKINGLIRTIPQVMWKLTGTDTPWTIFQLLVEQGAIAKVQGRYQFLFEGANSAIEKKTFYLKDYYSEIYSDQELRKQLFKQTKTVLDGMSGLPLDTLKYAETTSIE